MSVQGQVGTKLPALGFCIQSQALAPAAQEIDSVQYCCSMHCRSLVAELNWNCESVNIAARLDLNDNVLIRTIILYMLSSTRNHDQVAPVMVQAP